MFDVRDVINVAADVAILLDVLMFGNECLKLVIIFLPCAKIFLKLCIFFMIILVFIPGCVKKLR